jgi:predicted GIY-YIG superfamily endonuclease
LRPEDLASDLGIDGKRLRGWLRNRWPRRLEEHGQPWDLTVDQVAEVRRAFAGAQPRSSRVVIVRAGIPPESAIARPLESVDPPRPSTLSWVDLQRHAGGVLASGLRDLMGQPPTAWGPVDLHTAGVYVFSDGDATGYVGESISVSWRVGQHRDPESRLMAGLRAAGIADPMGHAASRLSIRHLAVDLGRLELEEFAIACLRPTANLMRRNSRVALAYADAEAAMWRAVQGDSGRLLLEGVRAAQAVTPVHWAAMRPPAGAGLYIVRGAGGEALYVGETDALRERLRTHAGQRSYFSALRRHVGTEQLGLAFAPNVRRGFSPADEARISAYLETCMVAIMPLAFGRWELERELVHEMHPVLNREHAQPMSGSGGGPE